MARIFYRSIHKMEPRPGVKYATEYLVQNFRDRKRLTRHIANVLQDIALLEHDRPGFIKEMEQPLKSFPKSTKGQYYSAWEIVEDMYKEATGRKRDGTPKDFAMAPIGRWNKLFKDTDREIVLEEEHLRTQYGELFQ